MFLRKSLTWFLPLVFVARCYGQSGLKLSSASAAPGTPVSLNIFLNTAHPGDSAGLQWTLNAPSPAVVSFTTSAGPAAASAMKSLHCANNTCQLVGLNSIPLTNGIVAVVTLNLAATATGNLVIQLSNPIEALLDGTGGNIAATSGLVNVTAISVSLAPTTASLHGAQSLQFSASITGAANSGIMWTMHPALGTLSSAGLYKAPLIVSSTQTIAVTATSVEDPTKSISATIALIPITVALSPSVASLQPSQTQRFIATIANADNTAVSWAIDPAVGTIANGVYTAPAEIDSAQNVIVKATSLADPTKSAIATVALVPPLSVVVSPRAVSLASSQIQRFAATVSHAENPAVSWTIAPQIGSIVNGLYKAPASIVSPQVVTITAASVQDPTKSGSVIALLIPDIIVKLTPAVVSLRAGQEQHFEATLLDATHTAVNWSLHPNVGTISNGLYVAPGRIQEVQTVTVTATSLADATITATAVINLIPSTSAPPGS